MSRFLTSIGLRALLCAAAALGMIAAVASAAEAAAPAWRTLAVTGPTNLTHYGHWQIVNVQAAAGTFNLTFDGSSTADLPFNTPAAQVEAALNALPSIAGTGNSVRVYGGPGQADGTGRRPYRIEFAAGPLASTEVSAITAGNGVTPLSGGNPNHGGTLLAADREPSGTLGVWAANVGGAPSSGTATLTIGPLPTGVETAGSATGVGWTCPGGAGLTTVVCTRNDAIPGRRLASPVRVPLRVNANAAPSAATLVSMEGGGAAPDPEQRGAATAAIAVSTEDVAPGVQAFWAGAFDDEGNPSTQAGGHPDAGAAMFVVNTNLLKSGFVVPAGDPRDVVVDLPAGFVGNPTVTDRCPANLVATCSPLQTDVGGISPLLQKFASGDSPFDPTNRLSNDMPPNGYAAQFTFSLVDARAAVVASVRTDDDFGVTALAPQIPTTYRVFGAFTVLDGQPEDADGKAFLTNPTDCGRAVLPTTITSNWWQAIDVFSDPLVSDSPAVSGCELVPFEPAMTVEPTVSSADSASGLDASIDVPQENLIDPNEIATAHLKKTVVQLPEGLSVNPSAATGLKGCSDAQVALKSKAEPACPDASKLGTVSVTSPLLDQPLDGVMYLGTPKSTDPMSGEMLRLFLVVRNDRYGLLVKLPGSAVADPQTGRLTATFDENPRVPFDHLEVELRGGSRGLLATPQDCGSASTSTSLSPWSGTADVEQVSPFEVAGNCGLGFAPRLAAGMSSSKARGNGSYSFRFSRPDGEQIVDGLTAKLPKGLLASVRDVALCSDGLAAAGVCPEGSRIGMVDATAGAGDPFVLERKGSVYLTEGYKGCAYGLLVSVPVVAGPFDASAPETDLGSVNVRQAVCVDPSTADITATSDPLPTIWHGVPLRVRSVTVIVDRPDFMLNPSDCSSKQTSAVFDSDRGASASNASPFNAASCSSLAFKPKLALRLTGRKQTRTGKHPGIKATVTQAGVSEAGIEKAVVRLPKSLALDPENAQALCEFEDGTKPDLENHCPKGSIVGRARAKTPLLKDDLAGNVYFVKNVRNDPKTGNEIRTLPMIVVALRGEIAINLRGESDTTKAGKLVNTFANVPDAPISQFNLNINGGKTGIIAVTRTRKAMINLCAGRHTAETEIDGHNSRRYDRDIRMKTPCSKKQTKAAKRAAAKAKRAAAKARNA